jgi:hypothetical protein
MLSPAQIALRWISGRDSRVLTSLFDFTRSLAYGGREVRDIRANAFCPGWTNMRQVDWIAQCMMRTNAEAAKQFAEGQNIQKRIVEPDELGAVVAMLASESRFSRDRRGHQRRRQPHGLNRPGLASLTQSTPPSTAGSLR